MRTVAITLLCLLSSGVFAQNREMLPTEVVLQKLLQDAGVQNGTVAFLAVNLDNGRVIAEHNTYTSMIPASLQKLVTTAVALEKLGPGFSYKTEISTDGEIDNSTLNGNLYVIASGDPTLNSRHYQSDPPVRQRIKNAMNGITTFEGKVIIDASHYSRYTTPRGWIWEDMGNYFGASPSALMWEDNLLEVYLRTGQAGSDAVLAPASSKHKGFEIDIQVKAADSKRDDAWFFGAPGSNTIYAKGTIPAHQEKFLVKAAHPYPMEEFVKDISRATDLKKLSSQIDYDYIEHEGLKPLVTITSPPLSTIVRLTNQKSINLYAEALNIELDEEDHYKSVAGGIATVESYLKSQKVNMKGVRITDGSGLSPLNRTTCQTMVDVLSVMYRSENKETFMNSLAVAGQSGTIARYFKGTKAQGNLKAKSGTMTGVRNYAGYVKNSNGEMVAFCILINDYNEARKAQIMNRIEELMAAVIEDQ